MTAAADVVVFRRGLLMTGRHAREASGAALSVLLASWNVATAPYVPRTPTQHARCWRVARAVKGRIHALGFLMGRDFRELSDGRLVLSDGRLMLRERGLR